MGWEMVGGRHYRRFGHTVKRRLKSRVVEDGSHSGV